MKIVLVVGARPNFMKVAPLIHEIDKHNSENADQQIEYLLVHTGQHYDDRMSKDFFKSLNIPEADINLGIGSGSHAEQVGNTMIAFEKVVHKERPDIVIVFGDVNATCACSITAKKEHVKLMHVEAGLRSGDMNMPEEINRLVTDRLADYLLTPDELSNENLRNEGAEESRIKFVGNIMIDTLEGNIEKANQLLLPDVVSRNLLDNSEKVSNLESNKYVVVTLHRPSNVDDKGILGEIVDFLIDEVSSSLPVLWSVHPRTRKQLELFNLWSKVVSTPNIHLLHPIGYHDLLKLNSNARIVLTDSGGLQEECTILGTPCLTLRWNTERPVTLREHGGASVLVGNNVDLIRKEYTNTLSKSHEPQRPDLWDGNVSKRILDILLSI